MGKVVSCRVGGDSSLHLACHPCFCLGYININYYKGLYIDLTRYVDVYGVCKEYNYHLGYTTGCFII